MPARRARRQRPPGVAWTGAVRRGARLVVAPAPSSARARRTDVPRRRATGRRRDRGRSGLEAHRLWHRGRDRLWHRGRDRLTRLGSGARLGGGARLAAARGSAGSRTRSRQPMRRQGSTTLQRARERPPGPQLGLVDSEVVERRGRGLLRAAARTSRPVTAPDRLQTASSREPSVPPAQPVRRCVVAAGVRRARGAAGSAGAGADGSQRPHPRARRRRRRRRRAARQRAPRPRRSAARRSR